MPTVNITAIRTRVFREGEGLAVFVHEHVPEVSEGTIIAITSKIVALSEGRTATEGEEADLIRAESEWQLPTKYGQLTLKDGLYMWNAGIDGSNADGKVIMLPRDSYEAAASLRTALMERYGLKTLGILITDSRIMPLRAGVVGIGLGYAGFKGLRDYRGKEDIFGRPLKYTQTDMVDSLASAAIAVMGEGSEQQPLCIIENAPVEFTEAIDRTELIVPPEDDMYGPLLRR